MGTLPPPETLRASLPHPPLALHSAADASAPNAASSRLAALRHFDDIFRETSAISRRDVEKAFRLRYQVYCLDRSFESADKFSGGMEKDGYDVDALHCLLRDRASNTSIGTVRLVQPPASPTWFNGLPLAEYAPHEGMEEIMRLPAGATAEVSRFAITRSASKILQAADKAMVHRHGDAPDRGSVGERLLPYMSLGLIRGLVRLSVEHGITHWCLAAEPSLLRRLRNFGLHFRNAGPLVDHRGLRQVCYAELSELLERARAERPQFWDIMTVGGFLVSDALVRTAA